MPQICDMEQNGFTSLPKEGMLRIFSPEKIRRFRPGANPLSWIPEASMLTQYAMLRTTFGEFWFKKRKKIRLYSQNFQRNHRNKQYPIPLHRGASVFHANRSNLHPPFVDAFPNSENRPSASPCLSVCPPV
jgi:hypothetical protein